MTKAELITFLNDISAPDLIRRREALGLTQAELALLLDVIGGTVSRWETGKIKIPKAVDAALRLLEMSQENASKAEK